ncbi:hypothetical protein PUN28_013401 [Cardiocondyla obscurior]|uniref:Uncharacterized protein n=1 Tax=Cardiocondyla obscurior TaxID=286306 RepID=A0AAW2FAX2_9HYME
MRNAPFLPSFFPPLSSRDSIGYATSFGQDQIKRKRIEQGKVESSYICILIYSDDETFPR